MRVTNIFAGKTVTLMGLGGFATGSGISAALFLAPRAKKLIITDMKDAAALAVPLKRLAKYKNIVLHLAGHRESDFIKTDWVVRNPDVPASSPYLALARAHHIPVDNDVTLFLRLFGAERVIGVTGTRGKTTTTHLIHAMLAREFPGAMMGGNMGVSPLTFLTKLRADAPVVLELSSFMLHDFLERKQSPHISVWTTCYPDHLNKYDSFEQYVGDKCAIFRFQQEGDVKVINADDAIVRAQEKLGSAHTYRYSAKRDGQKFAHEIAASRLIGQHNIGNVMAATIAARAAGVSDKNIRAAIRAFRGVPYRLELIRTRRGVHWYNDSTATSPEATIAALASFPGKRVHLITGGNSKGSDLGALAKAMRKQAHTIIRVPGNANDGLPQGIDVADLPEAITHAASIAHDGDIVLFSPGLTWLPGINEFKRGDWFVDLVKKLK
jgi:UDP-N-acetylmuramoylalanine--D-glutamate ligase